MEATPTIARNAELQDLYGMLVSQDADKVDAVVPLRDITSKGAILHVKGLRVFGDAEVRPTAIMDGHIADRLQIPVKYVRRMRTERPDLYDANFNGLVQGHILGRDEANARRAGGLEVADADGRKVLLRSFLGIEGEGIGRALLSDSYAPIDNLDVLMATLEGVNAVKEATGKECEIVSANLSETRMTVRFACPEIAAMAPTLLKHYRTPGGIEGLQLDSVRHYWHDSDGVPPVTFAGFDVSNSETGGSAFVITPVLTVLACKNGMKVNALAVRKIHLGSKLEEGVIRYSEDTKRKNVELIAAETRDTVATFLSQTFLQEQINAIEAKAGNPVEDAVATIEFVAKKQAYTEEQQAGILSHFIQGGQMTAGGVLNAVTSFAQTVADPDEAFVLEGGALEVLDLVSA